MDNFTEFEDTNLHLKARLKDKDERLNYFLWEIDQRLKQLIEILKKRGEQCHSKES